MTVHDLIAFVWASNSWFGRLILLVLLGLGGAAAWAALRHLNRYRTVETRALRGVESRLERLREEQMSGIPEAARPPVPPPVDLAALREGVPEHTLIGERLAALARMKQARVKVNVDALQQITLLRESANRGLAFPAYAVDLAMMLGMLGTFVGLCLMLLDMQGVVPAASGVPAAGGFAEAVQSLGGIITSKKTAFVTTLVGLSCAVVVSGLNFLLAREQSAFYGALERFTAEALLPATVPTMEDETAIEKLSVQLGDTIARLDRLWGHHGSNLDRLQEMQESFAAIVGSVRAITQQSARGPAEEAAGALTSVVGRLADANDALVKVAESVSASAALQRRGGYPGRRSGSVGGWVDDGLSLLWQNPLPALVGAGALGTLLVLVF